MLSPSEGAGTSEDNVASTRGQVKLPEAFDKLASVVALVKAGIGVSAARGVRVAVGAAGGGVGVAVGSGVGVGIGVGVGVAGQDSNNLLQLEPLIPVVTDVPGSGQSSRYLLHISVVSPVPSSSPPYFESISSSSLSSSSSSSLEVVRKIE